MILQAHVSPWKSCIKSVIIDFHCWDASGLSFISSWSRAKRVATKLSLKTPQQMNGWNTRMKVWFQMIFLCKWVFFMFHVQFPWCKPNLDVTDFVREKWWLEMTFLFGMVNIQGSLLALGRVFGWRCVMSQWVVFNGTVYRLEQGKLVDNTCPL